MDVYRGLEAFVHDGRPVVVALGTFDGVHLGHRAVLGQARAAASALGGRSVALTFDPHPRQVIAPPAGPFLLTTLEERLQLLAALGLDAAVVVTFDDALRRTPPEGWVERLVGTVRPVEVVTGTTYRYGRDRAGTVEDLSASGRRYGFAVSAVPPTVAGGAPVSSTRIRGLLRNGAVEEAGRLLGRPYAVRGRVVAGDGRGRRLGFPTANLQPPAEKLLPGSGVYAGLARLHGAGGGEEPTGGWAAAVNVGTRPTFGAGPLTVEAYLLDFSGDLYGRELEVTFLRRLRDEAAFGRVEDLVRQIAEDVQQVRALLAASGRGTPGPGR